jgi:3-oxoacyl-[acyl-carrier protein] reductase
MSSLDTKVAFVTGGARGIGAAIVERLAQEGAIVRFTYVSNTTAADGLVTRLNAAGGQVDAVRVDAADIEATQSAIHALVSAKGGLDIVVASAGAFLLGPIDTFAQEDFDRVMNINVRGVWGLIKAAAPKMRTGGRIVTIGSTVANRAGWPGVTVYMASKAAVAGMVRGLAHELGPRRITVNNIQPGPTETDSNPGDGPQADFLRSISPLGRMGQPSEIAALVAYLAGPEGGYVTGSSLTIDGGANA